MGHVPLGDMGKHELSGPEETLLRYVISRVDEGVASRQAVDEFDREHGLGNVLVDPHDPSKGFVLLKMIDALTSRGLLDQEPPHARELGAPEVVVTDAGREWVRNNPA